MRLGPTVTNIRAALQQPTLDKVSDEGRPKEAISIFAKVHAPLTLPSPRAGESEAGAQRGERDQGRGTGAAPAPTRAMRYFFSLVASAGALLEVASSCLNGP
jgi:hypothetical protein